MNEDKIASVFIEYMTAEMSLIDENLMDMEHKPYSRSFKKRFRRLTRAEKYFGGSVKVYNIVRRVAIFVLITLSLIAANEVSARVFGFSFWNFVTRYDSTSIMEDRYYKDRKPDDGKDWSEPMHDVPTILPEKMIVTLSEKTKEGHVFYDWKDKNGIKSVQYTRFKISQESMISTDAEYISKETVNITGYPAKICYKKDGRVFINWEDRNYSYMIELSGFENEKEILEKMANSIYEE